MDLGFNPGDSSTSCVLNKWRYNAGQKTDVYRTSYGCSGLKDGETDRTIDRCHVRRVGRWRESKKYFTTAAPLTSKTSHNVVFQSLLLVYL